MTDVDQVKEGLEELCMEGGPGVTIEKRGNDQLSERVEKKKSKRRCGQRRSLFVLL